MSIKAGIDLAAVHAVADRIDDATQLIDETMVVRAVSPAENRSRFNPHRADKHSRPEVRVNPRVA